MTGPRRVIAAVAVGLVASGALATATGGKPRRTPGVAILSPQPIVFGDTGVILGRVTGKDRAGRTAVLYADPSPYGRAHPRARTITGRDGSYRFVVAPRVNTRYRVRFPGPPPALMSARVTLEVRFRVTLSLSDQTPPRGWRVRFSGSVQPARDGRRTRIQKLSSRGTFSTVAETRLLDAGVRRSRYSERLRITRSAVYRVRVVGDRANAPGYSRSVAVVVR